jgi:hypothetical protein
VLTIPVSGPVINNTSLVSGVVGSQYSTTFAATGGVGTLMWSVPAGTQLAGLSLTSDGTLSGTPTSSGTFNFTLTVTDTSGNTDAQALTLLVSPASGDLIISDGAPGAANSHLVRLNPFGNNSNVMASITGRALAVAVDPKGNSYVAVIDSTSNTASIIKVTPFGSQSIFFSGSPLQSPVAVAVDASGNLYVGDNATDAIYQFGAKGNLIGPFGTIPSSPGLGQDIRMAFDASGNLIVASDTGAVPGVVEIDLIPTNGASEVTIYQTPQPAVSADLTSVGGLAIAGNGDYVVADFSAGSIVDISNPGTANMSLTLQVSGLPRDGTGNMTGLVIIPTNVNPVYDVTLNFTPEVLQVTPGGTVNTIFRGSPLTFPTDAAQFFVAPPVVLQ